MLELNIPLEKLIASKDIVAQCKKENRIFTPFEQAVLIYQNPLLSHDEMLTLLTQIDDSIKDDAEYNALHQQISERIKFQNTLLEKFYSKEDNQYFSFSYKDENSELINEERCFSDLESLFKYVDESFTDNNHESVFTIHKNYLNLDIDITANIDKDKRIISLFSWKLDPVDYSNNATFENAFIEIPFPFRSGDFVHTIGDSKIAIFTSCKDEDDYRKRIELRKNLIKKGVDLDTTDISCRVESLEQSYENPRQLCFQHYHPSLLTLEYAELKEDDKNYKLLKAAQDLMKGNGSLEVFCNYLI